MPPVIPFTDLSRLHSPLGSRILRAWSRLLRNAAFVHGPAVSRFEERFAQVCGVPHAVAVHSGTAALRLTLMALGIRPGDEVITVPNSFFATAEAVTLSGARLVFCDVHDKSYTLDPQKLSACITSRTVGVIPVHLYGQSADMDPIRRLARRHGLFVLEDACQAHGAEYKGRPCGSLGNAAAFSFYPSKNLGACGEGGCVNTADAALAGKIRALRDHGQRLRHNHLFIGDNARLDTLQAEALTIKLSFLESWTRRRIRAAQWYAEYLHQFRVPVTPPMAAEYARHVFHLYVVQSARRDALRRYLESHGIQTGVHYPVPIHLTPAYRHLQLPAGSFPIAEGLSRRVLSLPLFPHITRAQVKCVVRTMINYLC